jgi:hypothetical protein
MHIKDAVKAILEGNRLDDALGSLLEADTSSRAMLKALKADPADSNLWIKVVNTLAQHGQFLKIVLRRPRSTGNSPRALPPHTVLLVYKAATKKSGLTSIFYYLTSGDRTGYIPLETLNRLYGIKKFDSVAQKDFDIDPNAWGAIDGSQGKPQQ